MSALCAWAALLSSEFVLSELQPDFLRSVFVSLTTWLANDVAAVVVTDFFCDELDVDGSVRCASTREVRDGDEVFVFFFAFLATDGEGDVVGCAVSCGRGPLSATVFAGPPASPSSERPTVTTVPST